MLAIKARYDGRKVVLPKRTRRPPPGDVIVVFTNMGDAEAFDRHWLRAQERAFARVWDNDEDAVYDSL